MKLEEKKFFLLRKPKNRAHTHAKNRTLENFTRKKTIQNNNKWEINWFTYVYVFDICCDLTMIYWLEKNMK